MIRPPFTVSAEDFDKIASGLGQGFTVLRDESRVTRLLAIAGAPMVPSDVMSPEDWLDALLPDGAQASLMLLARVVDTLGGTSRTLVLVAPRPRLKGATIFQAADAWRNNVRFCSLTRSLYKPRRQP